jgi:hypothetical protein
MSLYSIPQSNTNMRELSLLEYRYQPIVDAIPQPLSSSPSRTTLNRLGEIADVLILVANEIGTILDEIDDIMATLIRESKYLGWEQKMDKFGWLGRYYYRDTVDTFRELDELRGNVTALRGMMYEDVLSLQYE